MTPKNTTETEQRLDKILQGAFKGPPTPLKDIPKKRSPNRRPEKHKATPRK